MVCFFGWLWLMVSSNRWLMGAAFNFFGFEFLGKNVSDHALQFGRVKIKSANRYASTWNIIIRFSRKIMARQN